MGDRPPLESPLGGRVVALPESRQLDVLAGLFERRGARVMRIPLVSIRDHPDQAAIQAWLRDFDDYPPDLFILYTGEGLRRLLQAAERGSRQTSFISTLARVKKLVRGPKPARVLAGLGLQPDYQAAQATTAGIIQTLSDCQLLRGKLAVQTYGAEPVGELQAYLDQYPALEISWVAPYVYSAESDTPAVLRFVEQLASKQVDLLAFTSKTQVERLWEIASQHGKAAMLEQALQHTLIAAVGPVVGSSLRERGCRVAIMPENKYFMKPLLRASEAHFASPGN